MIKGQTLIVSIQFESLSSDRKYPNNVYLENCELRHTGETSVNPSVKSSIESGIAQFG